MASDPPFHFIAVYIVDMNIAECEIYKTRREKKGSEIRSVYVYIYVYVERPRAKIQISRARNCLETLFAQRRIAAQQ